ncbi:alpha/beta fold hydrolase [Massilia sp. S19_KUP03_FR1]|uniref:alpha/beta fold hydrolase n=1 Tax=Massilia sp. S19_KUP03_FR1 TaxID=3025503 RepID=UPI002FCDD54D
MTVLYVVLLVILALIGAVYGLNKFAPGVAALAGLTIERRLARLAWDSARIPGAEMPYLEGGRGETIVLVHGFGADKDNFIRLAVHLTRHYHVVIPDLPAFGEASRDPDADYSIAAQASNLHAFLYKLGLDRVHLGGSSMGGFIATEFAARYPERVASLWLLSAAGTAAGLNSDLERQYLATGLMPWLVQDLASFERLLIATTARPPFLPSSTRRRLALRGAVDFELHQRVMRQLQDSPFLEARYFRIEAPALIVWGTLDQIHNAAGADALQAIMPNSRVIRMPGIGHLPMVEAPRRCAIDYLAFLAALPRPGSD